MAKNKTLSAKEIRGRRLLILRRVIAYFVLIVVCVVAIFPFVTLLVNLTKDHATLTSTFNLFPGKEFLNNWNKVIDDSNLALFQSMFNSFVVAAISCVVSVYIATLTAYGLYAYDFRLKKFAFIFIMVILMVPTQVSALGYVNMVRAWGMTNSYIPLIFPMIAAPGVFFFVKQYI